MSVKQKDYPLTGARGELAVLEKYINNTEEMQTNCRKAKKIRKIFANSKNTIFNHSNQKQHKHLLIIHLTIQHFFGTGFDAFILLTTLRFDFFTSIYF